MQLLSLLNNVYFLVIVVGLSSAIGDALINQYVKMSEIKWFVFGCLGWCLSAAFWSQILRHQLFAPSAVLFFLGNICFAALLGYFYFGDRVTGAQWAWIVVATIAAIFIVRSGS